MIQDNLIRLRKKNGMTQAFLASKIHVTRQTISKWEKGLSVPNAEDLLRLSEVFGEDISVLLETDVSKQGHERIKENNGNANNNDVIKMDGIGNQISQNSEQWNPAGSRRKWIRWIPFGIILLLLSITGFIVYRQKSTFRYGYVGSQSMIHDASEITDLETLNWIQSCDRQEKEYFILFSACSPAEISEGYVGKVLVYVPKGFSSLDYYFNNDNSLFRRGKSMDLQIGSVFTEDKKYQLALIEAPQNNISKITMRDMNGRTIEPVITKTPNQFYAYGKYYEFYQPDGCDLDMHSDSTVEAFLTRMPMEKHFGRYRYSVSGSNMNLEFEKELNDTDNNELRKWGMVFIARMKGSDIFAWSYPGADGKTVTKEVTRKELNDVFPDGYHRTWEEFQVLCP